MSEQNLVRACMQYLALGTSKWKYWRNNTGAMKDGAGNFMRFGAVGSPDIYVLKAGKLIGFELKAGKNKQSDAQKEWEKDMKKHGGEYHVIYDIETFILKLL